MPADQKERTAFEAVELQSQFERAPEALSGLEIAEGSADTSLQRPLVGGMRVTKGKPMAKKSQHDASAFSLLIVEIFYGKKCSFSDVTKCLVNSPTKIEISKCTLLLDAPELWVDKRTVAKCIEGRAHSPVKQIFSVMYDLSCAARGAAIRGRDRFETIIAKHDYLDRPISAEVFKFSLEKGVKGRVEIVLQSVTPASQLTSSHQPGI